MGLSKKHSQFIGSIEDASIIRKFTILFLLMSILPILTLYYFFTQIKKFGTIQVTEDQFLVTLLLLVAGGVVGYVSMRRVLNNLVNLISANHIALERMMSPETMKSMSMEKNEIAVLAQSFSVITERLEDNVRKLELAKRTLHSVMKKVGHGISNMRNIDTFLELILEATTEALAGKVGVLLFVDEKDHTLSIKTVYGVKDKRRFKKLIHIDENTMFGSVVRQRTPILVSRMSTDFVDTDTHGILFNAPLVCVPLVNQDKVIGVMSVSGKQNETNFNEDEMNLLFNLSSQVAVAIENARLNKNIEATYFETISALALAVDAKDAYSRGHLDRVANYCVIIAEKLGLDDHDIKTLRDAARLHDLGKIGIPDSVLGKPGPLDKEEWQLMCQHPEIGEGIIKPIRSLSHLCDIIRHHHEKLDGKGYPDGLQANEITPLVRITTVADIYDALTSDRSYRKQMTHQKAVEVMRDMGEQLDQDIVEVLFEAMEDRRRQNEV